MVDVCKKHGRSAMVTRISAMPLSYCVATVLSLTTGSYAAYLQSLELHRTISANPGAPQEAAYTHNTFTRALVPIITCTIALAAALILCAKKKQDDVPAPARAISANPNIVYEDLPKQPQNGPANRLGSDAGENTIVSDKNQPSSKSTIKGSDAEDFDGFHSVHGRDDTLPRPPTKAPTATSEATAPVFNNKPNTGYVGFDAVKAALDSGDTKEEEESFGGFSAVSNTAGDTGGDDANEADGEDDAIPAWYAGKISRDICEEVVLAASTGDFLVRESSKGDRCVICINSHGTALNLMVVVHNNKYRFAGKDRDSLHDVIFFLRKRPITSGAAAPFKLAKAAPGMREGN